MHLCQKLSKEAEANAVYCVKDERPKVATNKEVDVQTAERFAAVEVAAKEAEISRQGGERGLLR